MSARSVIIVGAASAIGQAVARRFADAGDNLVLADTDEAAGRALAASLQKTSSAVFVAASVANRLHVHNIIAEALETYGRVDVLINVTIDVALNDFLETSEDAFDQLIGTNLRGAFLMAQAAARQFAKQIEQSNDSEGDYAIVNLLSTEAVTAAPDRVAFAASQGGLQQLTKAVALALSSVLIVNGVDVVAPVGATGALHGHRVRAADAQAARQVAAVGIGAINAEYMDEFDTKSARLTVPLNRIGDPMEVAEAIHFLASTAASYITGQTLFVDGGRLVRSGAADYVEKT